MSSRSLRLVAGLVFVSVLAGCGEEDTPAAQTNAANTSAVNIQSYAQALGTAETPPTLELSVEEAAEVASRSRWWAAEALTSQDGELPDNALVIPPLYFARTEAIAMAASGTTLDQLRTAYPALTSSRVADGLMRGIARTLKADANFLVSTSFLDAVSAHTASDIWSSLSIQPLSSYDAPNLRFKVEDAFSVNVAWSQATTFAGVFQNEGEDGARFEAQMVRVTGPLLTVADAKMAAIALSLPQGKWLVRITPSGSMRSWSSVDLETAIADVSASIAKTAGQSLPAGELILPKNADFRTDLTDDRRGMQEAQDQVQADMRGLDGHGGTYVEFGYFFGMLRIDEHGATLAGDDTVSFIFSSLNNFNENNSADTTLNIYPTPQWVTCGAQADLRPGFLLLLDEHSRIEFAARFVNVGDAETPCLPHDF